MHYPHVPMHVPQKLIHYPIISRHYTLDQYNPKLPKKIRLGM